MIFERSFAPNSSNWHRPVRKGE